MIDSSAIIEDGAIIAEDVTIGPFCFVGKEVTIAKGARLESNVIIKGKTSIGADAHIFSFATIGDENSKITIGTKVTIREFVQIDTNSKSTRSVCIQDECFIMAYVQIFSGVQMGAKCIVTNAVRLYEDVICDDFVIIGGLSSIEAGNKIGMGVMVGGASYVTHDLPPFCLIEGNRSKIKGLNLIGLRRRIDDLEVIEEIKSAYKKLLNNGVKKELAKEIAANTTNSYVKQFATFIYTSNL